MSTQAVIAIAILAVAVGASFVAMLNRKRDVKKNAEFMEESMSDWRAGKLVREQERTDKEAVLELQNNLRGSRRGPGE